MMMALKPMPNDVNPEAKTDIEHDPKQPGGAELCIVVVYVFMFTCC